MTDSGCKFTVLLNTVVVVKAFSESSYSTVDEQELATSVKEEVIFP